MGRDGHGQDRDWKRRSCPAGEVATSRSRRDHRSEAARDNRRRVRARNIAFLDVDFGKMSETCAPQRAKRPSRLAKHRFIRKCLGHKSSRAVAGCEIHHIKKCPSRVNTREKLRN